MSDRLSSADFAAQDANATGGTAPPERSRRQYIPEDAGPDDVHVLDFVKVIYKRRWAAATVFLIVFLTAVAHTFTATPIFEAKAQLLIESDTPNIVAFKAVIEEGQATADYYQTQFGILRSRGLARRTIEALRLWSSPHLGGTPHDESAPATPRTPDAETAQQSQVIDRFLENLTIEPMRNSRLVDVRFRSPDPGMAARVANELAKGFIAQALEYKFSASQEATGWLSERLAEQRKLVEVSEGKLQRYREQNGAISMDDRQNIVVQKLSDLNAAVTRAKTERFQKEAVERQMEAVENDPAKLDTLPTILGNSFIQRQKAELADLQQHQAELADKLGRRHPEMLAMRAAIENSQLELRAEVGKVVQSVHTDYEAALAQEQSLAKALEQQKAEALSMNRTGIEYSVLAREVESSRQIYQSLLQRAKETGVSGELRTSNIRIVDEAERPRSPASPSVPRNMALGGLGGLILALGSVFLFEYVDSRLKSPDEIQSCLGLPALGMIPELGKRWMALPPLLNTGVPPNFAETIRAIRTNILFSSPTEGPRTLVVTSPGPGEGKTLVASNLAIGFALAGQRVLLVDADMRRPRIHELFGVDQEPGLSNVLVGNGKASEVVRKTSVAGLWTITAGRRPPNPAELLGSKRFEDLLRSLGEHFDAIVIDTPPVMVVADPSVVSDIASGVIFVVAAEMTSRHTARTALEQLRRGRAKVLGAVLNRVRIDNNAYYYSRYYRREYAAYYRPAAS